jgi:hypothetical protein
MLIEKVGVAFSVLPGYGEYLADHLDMDFWLSRQMKGIQISNTRRQGKHYGLRTDKTHHGWQQR